MSRSLATQRPPEFRLYRPRPGHPDWPRLWEEARETAARLRPQLARPRGGAAELRRRLRSYATAVRNFGTNRRLMRAGREDLRPLYFVWTLLRSCNFRCQYCDDHQGRRYPDLPLEGALDTEQGVALLRTMRTRTPSVYFSGGEPTLRRDLPELTRSAWELGYHPIIINTNASIIDRLLLREAWRDWLAHMDIVVVSLDALDLGLLEKWWGYRHPETVIRNLLLLRQLAAEMGFKLLVNAVVHPGHVRHAQDVLDLVNDLGIWFTPVPLNRGPVADAGLLAEPEYRAFRELVLTRKRQGHRITGSLRLNRRLLGAEPLDCRNTLKPHVDLDGSLFWPCKASVNVKPRRIPVLEFESVDALYDHASRLIDPAGFHGSGPTQCGANCNWAQNYTTDAYVHGLANPLDLLSDIVEFIRAR